MAGLIDEVRKRGPRVILMLDDRTGRIEVTLFEDVFQQLPRPDRQGRAGAGRGHAALRRVQRRLAARRRKQLTELDKVREQQARRLVLAWPRTPRRAAARASAWRQMLTPWRPGPCPITVEYSRRGGQRRARRSDEEWNVRATRELLEQLEGLVGRDGVQVRLRRAAGAADPPGRLRLPGRTVTSPLELERYACDTMAVSFLDFEQPIAELEAKIEELKHVTSDVRGQYPGRDRPAAGQEPAADARASSPTSRPGRSPSSRAIRSGPTRSTTSARSARDFHELHGDRMYADDLAIVGGLGAARGPRRS